MGCCAGRRRIQALRVVGILVTLLTLPGCQKGEPKPEVLPAESGSSASVGGPSRVAGQSAASVDPMSARSIMSAMVEAYRKADTYSDEGYLQVLQEIDQRKDEQKLPFSVVLERPNRVRVEAYKTVIVCDGQKLRARIEATGNQVLEKDAPSRLTLRTVYSDPVVGEVISREFAGGPPQLLMLVEENALSSLLQDTREPQLLEPAEVDNQRCYRVAVTRPEGRSVFWIDQKTYALRRFEFPVDELRKQISAQSKVDEFSITAEFRGATLNGRIPSERFQFEMPQGAEVVKFLVPPEPGQLLGKKVPDFKFQDLEGHPLLPENLAGKVVVLKFWAVGCTPCRDTFPRLEKIYQKYKDNAKFAFLAVSVDPPSTPASALREALEKFGATLPIVRDNEEVMQRVFMTFGIPATFVLHDGVLQDFEIGVNPDLEKQLADKLEQLALGRSIVETGLRQYQQRLKNLEQTASRRGEDGPPEPPRAEIASASQPAHLKLKSLWRCTDVKDPACVLAVSDAVGTKIYVTQQYRSIAELDAEGKLVTTHALEMPAAEAVSMLRTTVAPDGKRYFLAWSPFRQQVHVFDQEWKSLLHFPPDALENNHEGITDAIFAPAEPNAPPDLIVAYWGTVGVQRVSPQGKRLWANRSMENVFGVVWSDAQPGAQSLLQCLTGRNSLLMLDGKGERKAEVPLDSAPMVVVSVVAADLAASGALQYCCRAQQPTPGAYSILGMAADGSRRWSYDLPVGVPNIPIEQIVPSRLLGSPGQWVIVGPDGSIHLLDPEGKLIDRFNYGAPLAGVGVGQIKDRPILLVSSPQGVEALELTK